MLVKGRLPLRETVRASLTLIPLRAKLLPAFLSLSKQSFMSVSHHSSVLFVAAE